MTRRLAFLALVALMAACGEDTTTIGVGLAEPTAAVAFRGYTTKHAGLLHPYFAVTNGGRDDVTLVDAEDDSPVLAPVIVRSLAVPVPDPRPALLVASTLWDATAMPDLLVVASAASPSLHLVETWNQSARVVDEVDLAPLAPGAVILALVAAPVPDDAIPPAKTPGRVRVIAALSGARLAVVEYARAQGGEAIVRDETTVSVRPLVAGDVPFDAVSLAVNPHDPFHLYAASPDPIGGVEGVAELTMAGAPAAWPIRALSARGPTRFVAAARVRERLDTWSPPPPGGDRFADHHELRPDAVDRVYAVLDPAGCGPDHRIGCGIAVLAPASGTIVPDYAGFMPYLAPIALPQLSLGLAIHEPPAVAPDGEEELHAGMSLDPDLPPPPPSFMKIAPGTGTRWTTAVAAIPSGDGRVYYADLARFAIPNDQSILRGGTRTRVDAGLAVGVAAENEPLPRILGIWSRPDPESPPVLAFEAPDILEGVRVTPGFTATETWRVAFQASLPGVVAQRGQSGRTVDARTWVAMQVPANQPGGATLTQVVRVYDPTFGIREGDLVEMFAPRVAGCPTDGNVEARIAAILPPADAYPGGALALEPLDDPRPKLNQDGSAGPWRDWPACVQALGAGQTGFQVGVRAAGLVAIGASTGYAGRPEIVSEVDVGTAPEFALLYEDEDALDAQCPLLPWPADWKSAPAEFSACDAACRLVCERLVLARRARRIYHVSDQCTATPEDAACRDAWGELGNPLYPFPRANGPVIAFQVGYREVAADAGRFPADVQALWSDLRGMEIALSTRGGLSPSSRIPTTSSTSTAIALPLGISTFDRSLIPGKEAEGYRFLVPYANDFVLDFSPGEPVNVARVIR